MLSPQNASRRTREICGMAPIIPVLVVEDPAHAAPLAKALIAGGLPVLEVTLRTPAALEVIAEMSGVAGGIVGAGTIVSPADVTASLAAGAQFGVSPGATDMILEAAEQQELPMLPGAASASEAMALLSRGYDKLKFFNAEAAGGVPFLKSLSSPLPQISFCPTGGVGPANAKDYLSLPNVLCAGGSWVAPGDLVKAQDWEGITALARDASQLT